MIRFILEAIAYVLLAIAPLFPPPALAQRIWGPRGCASVEAPDNWQWRKLSSDPDRIYLYFNGIQAGGWCTRARHYRAYEPALDRWLSAEPTPPVALPAGYETAEPPKKLVIGQEGAKAIDIENFGLDLDKIAKGKNRYFLNGKECCRDDVLHSLEFTDLSDDSDLLRVTFIGPADVAADIRRDLADAAPLALVRGKVLMQAYPSADAPMIRGLGFEGNHLYVQTPAGRCLHAQEGYRGPELLANALAEAELRRRDPHFDPRKIPDLNQKPRPLDGLRDMAALTGWLKRNWLLAVIAAFAGYYFLARKR